MLYFWEEIVRNTGICYWGNLKMLYFCIKIQILLQKYLDPIMLSFWLLGLLFLQRQVHPNPLLLCHITYIFPWTTRLYDRSQKCSETGVVESEGLDGKLLAFKFRSFFTFPTSWIWLYLMKMFFTDCSLFGYYQKSTLIFIFNHKLTKLWLLFQLHKRNQFWM